MISLCQTASKTEAFRRGLRLGVIPFVGAKQEALQELLDVGSIDLRSQPLPAQKPNEERFERICPWGEAQDGLC